MMITPQNIIDLCKKEWVFHKSDCSAFVEGVAADLGIKLTGQADDIVGEIHGGNWTLLPNGIAAKQKADAGGFVIGGLKGADNVPPQDHGHVVVVVSGPLDSTYGKYPTAYWGRLNGVGEENKTVNYAWNKNSVDQVYYAAWKKF
jgi:hypothetical protein